MCVALYGSMNNSNYSEDEQKIIKAVEAEVKATDNRLIDQRLKKVHFVSKSKGRGRKRKQWEEVLLINDSDDRRGPDRWTSYKKFSFDTVATEVLPHIHDGLEAEAMLMREFTP